MRPKNETISLLGQHYRELEPVETPLPTEVQVLLLRIALREVERTHYRMRNRAPHAGVA